MAVVIEDARTRDEAAVEATVRQEDLPFSGVTTERLEADITTLAGQLAAGECRLLLMVAELDRRAAWQAWGTKSCAHWLNFQCGIEMGAAREKVRVAHRICELPRVRAEFGQGRLS